jgi:DNA polymerase-3 subunit alpha
MPDLDIDFDKERVKDVAEYLKRVYGEDRVARIASFGNFWAKSTLREVGKHLELPAEEIDDLANAIPNSQGEFRVYLEDAMRDIPKIRDLATSPDETRRELFKICSSLEGIKRQVSTHACGVVIGDAPLSHYLALMTQKDGEADDLLQVQADMHTVDALGLLKMDLLALKTLTVIAKAEEMVSKKLGGPYDVEVEGVDNPQFYDFICSGRTMGLFQIESGGMRDVVMRIQPKSIRELSDTIALFRPGPNDAEDEKGLTMVDHYILRKHGREKVTYPHSCLESVLKSTYGIIVYQEQTMRLAMSLCGFSASEADNLRKAMGKKKPEEMAKWEDRFIQGATTHTNTTPQRAKEIWELINYFSRYGFNYSHSLGYAVLTMWTTALKVLHPLEFMCALLTCASGEGRNEEDLANYIDECWRLGIEVLEPDVNRSGVEFTIEDGAIRAGLGMVKGVAKSGGQIVAARHLLGSQFTNFDDFLEKCIEMKVTQSSISPLIRVGACDSMGERKDLLKRLAPRLSYLRRKKKAKKPDKIKEPEIAETIPMSPEEAQAEVLGMLCCYSLPRYPITRMVAITDTNKGVAIAEIVNKHPGEVKLIVQVKDDRREVSFSGTVAATEECLRDLRQIARVYYE